MTVTVKQYADMCGKVSTTAIYEREKAGLLEFIIEDGIKKIDTDKYPPVKYRRGMRGDTRGSVIQKFKNQLVK